MHLSPVRLESQGMFKTGGSFVQLALSLQDGAKIGVKSGFFWVDRNRPGNYLDRDRMLPELMLDHPEQVEAICVPGVVGESGTVNGFGFGQPARAMVPESLLQHILCG